MNHLTLQYRKYPICKVTDLIKQAYQAEFGDDVADEEALSALFPTSSGVRKGDLPQGNLYDVISDRFSRVHLDEYYRRGYSADLLFKLVGLTKGQGSKEGLAERLQEVVRLAENHELDFPVISCQREINKYVKSGCPVPKHSFGYQINYRPHYRVVLTRHAQYLPLIARIYNLLEKQNVLFVGIDGFCGAGKSHLASLLCEFFNAQVIHTDDFYLPQELRPSNWQQVVAGNVDLSRLGSTIQQATLHKQFDYRKFHCKSQSYSAVTFKPSRVVVVEGTYALHPSLQKYYDVQVMLTVSRLVQTSRLVARDKSAFPAFQEVWIPAEKRYFDGFTASEDLLSFDTTDFCL